MIKIIKFSFLEKKLLQQAFKIRQQVFVKEQNCPPDIEYEFEEELYITPKKVNGICKKIKKS